MTLWAVMLLKPLGFIAIAALWYFVVIKGLRWLYPRLPRSRFVDFLFKERSNRAPDFGPGFTARPRPARPPGQQGP
jgi:hypothetical protein